MKKILRWPLLAMSCLAVIAANAEKGGTSKAENKAPVNQAVLHELDAAKDAGVAMMDDDNNKKSVVGAAKTLFSTMDSKVPYRIPAIAQTKDGRLLALTDYRWCMSDIGYGRVDQRYRVSVDNGLTWGSEQVLIEGSGVNGDHRCGYGDPAIVADSRSNEVLLLCVTGHSPYATSTRSNPNRVALLRSKDAGRTWSEPIDITEEIYSLFDASAMGPVQSLFFGSGRICQSSSIKVGRYYRIYAALCARPNGNRVVYSDDFGRTWHALGSIDSSPAPKGDEPKIEELPNGDVVLSSRPGWSHLNTGRFFNIFKYTDKKKGIGQWGKEVPSAEQKDGVSCKENVTNGEILILKAKRKSNGKPTVVVLQSLPLGPGRKNVAIYWKELSSPNDYSSPSAFASNWRGPYLVSDREGAYSTMIRQQDGRIGFYWEDVFTPIGGYEMLYRSLTLEEITQDNFKMR